MDACLVTGVHYLDTDNYEPPEIPKFEYKWQWAYRETLRKSWDMALLAAGRSGVTSVLVLMLRSTILMRYIV
jgi:saccharopine dehydrogenase (NAD+, L-lysine-forming)